MKTLKSFPPVADRSARVLILGSMPGERSLTANQYYAHPRNAFWPIMCYLLGLEPDSPYETRLSALKAGRIALWDVLRSCIRPGSLDTSILAESIKPNDFRRFFREHPGIELVCFNGTMAERTFQTHVIADLGNRPVRYCRLPSTSPAHASRSYAEKCSAWREVLGVYLSPESASR